MKFLKIIKSIIISILVIIYLSFAIAMTMLAMNFNKYGNAVINGYTFILMKDEVTSKKYEKNDLIITSKVAKNAYDIGAEVFLYKITEEKTVEIVIGIVESLDEGKEGVQLENGEFYSRDFVIGEPYKVIPGLGGILAKILNKTGFLFIIIVPIFFIFTAQVYALIVEIKFGDDASEKEDKPKKNKKIKKKKEEEEPDKEEEKTKPIKEEPKKEESLEDMADDFLND